jgi:plasmid stability protein
MTEGKQATIYLDTHLHRRLKVQAARLGTSMSALVNEAVRKDLEREEGEGGRASGLTLDWAGALADLKDEVSGLM